MDGYGYDNCNHRKTAKMMAHRNDTPTVTANTLSTLAPAKCDPRAYVCWRPGRGERLMAAIARHRRGTGWGGYIIVQQAA